MSLPVTAGTLLGGRVRYDQPALGHRSGLEPVLLAASVPARPGERVLEGGTGAGAALLCLAARVPGVEGLGVELDAPTAALARANMRANGHERLRVLDADLLLCAAALAESGPFDHALANPPWHEGPPSATPRRALARSTPSGEATLAGWVHALSAPLRRGGTVTLALPASLLGAGLAALAPHAGAVRLLPLWPRAGEPARLLLLRGRRGIEGGCTLLPGLVLHRADGGFTEAAEAVLRGGEALDWG